MPELLSLEEVCAVLKVRRQTIRLWCERGLFPKPIRFGRTVRFNREEIAAALKNTAQAN